MFGLLLVFRMRNKVFLESGLNIFEINLDGMFFSTVTDWGFLIMFSQVEYFEYVRMVVVDPPDETAKHIPHLLLRLEDQSFFFDDFTSSFVFP